ncbi:MAG: hypothetical protein HOO96_30670, partial [Polyangiaceae bacterium]|nr:hypothetical protein [Polyangiaceae bacterium]
MSESVTEPNAEGGPIGAKVDHSQVAVEAAHIGVQPDVAEARLGGCDGAPRGTTDDGQKERVAVERTGVELDRARLERAEVALKLLYAEAALRIAKADGESKLAPGDEYLKKRESEKRDLEAARHKLEVAELASKTLAVSPPWWRDTGKVTLLTAMIAASAPLTVGVQGWFQKAKELDLAAASQGRELQDRYLASASKDERTLKMSLEFVKATADDPRIKGWAAGALEDAKHRDEVYAEAYVAIHRIAKTKKPPLSPDDPDVMNFRRLYEDRLLTIESPAMEVIVENVAKIIGACQGPESSMVCQMDQLATLAHDFQRQRSIEIGTAPSPPATSAVPTTSRYSRQPCGAIVDLRYGLEWYVAPESVLQRDGAELWAKQLLSCGGGWRLPSQGEVALLFEADKKAGTGFQKNGQSFPARIDPVFSEIGEQSWVWTSRASDATNDFAYN